MQKRFALYFDETGLLGVDPPSTDDPQELAANFALLKRLAVAIQNFGDHIREIEAVYQGLQEQSK